MRTWTKGVPHPGLHEALIARLGQAREPEPGPEPEQLVQDELEFEEP